MKLQVLCVKLVFCNSSVWTVILTKYLDSFFLLAPVWNIDLSAAATRRGPVKLSANVNKVRFCALGRDLDVLLLIKLSGNFKV